MLSDFGDWSFKDWLQYNSNRDFYGGGDGKKRERTYLGEFLSG